MRDTGAYGAHDDKDASGEMGKERRAGRGVRGGAGRPVLARRECAVGPGLCSIFFTRVA